MNSKEIVEELTNEIIGRGQTIYKNLYEHPSHPAPEIDFFNSISDSQKDLFFKILRDVQVDTMASVLGYLDGDFLLPSQSDSLHLSFEGNHGSKLNGCLADSFLDFVSKIDSQS